MIAPWTNDYVGIPYRPLGRDRDGCDCWGLARLVVGEQFSVWMPSFSDYEDSELGTRDIIDDRMPLVNAAEVQDPEIGDIALIRIKGQPCHVGIVVGEGFMLHTLRAHEAALDRYDGPRWSGKIEGFYRVR